MDGGQVRQHLVSCIQVLTGLQPARNPQGRGRGRIAQRTAYLSVRARERPTGWSWGVRYDTTLRELDQFLRAIWLGCCGHLSHFRVGDVVYSVMVSLPGEQRRWDPEYEHEENWKHMGRTVSATIPPLTIFHPLSSPAGPSKPLAGWYGAVLPARHGLAQYWLAKWPDYHTHIARGSLQCFLPADSCRQFT